MEDERVSNHFLGGVLKRITDWFLPKLPKAFRKFLEAHKNEKLESLVIYRAPLDHVSNGFLNLLTAGDWNAIKAKSSIDQLFHVYAIINDKYIYEKTALPQFKMATHNDIYREEADNVTVPIHHSITLGQFCDRAALKMGDRFFSYDGFTNNCQDFLLGSLQGNHLQRPDIVSFFKQDIKKLVENVPEWSRYLGKETTDLAGAGERIYSEIVDKHGGVRRRTHNMEHGRRHWM